MFVNIPSMKFHKNLLCRRRVVPRLFTIMYMQLCLEVLITNPQVKIITWKLVLVSSMTEPQQQSMIT
jgi:hypothetical protein